VHHPYKPFAHGFPETYRSFLIILSADDKQSTVAFPQGKISVLGQRTVNTFRNSKAFLNGQLGFCGFTAVVNGKDVYILPVDGMLREPDMGMVAVAAPPHIGTPCQLPVDPMIGWGIHFGKNVRGFCQVPFQGKSQKIHSTLTHGITEEYGLLLITKCQRFCTAAFGVINIPGADRKILAVPMEFYHLFDLLSVGDLHTGNFRKLTEKSRVQRKVQGGAGFYFFQKVIQPLLGDGLVVGQSGEDVQLRVRDRVQGIGESYIHVGLLCQDIGGTHNAVQLLCRICSFPGDDDASIGLVWRQNAARELAEKLLKGTVYLSNRFGVAISVKEAVIAADGIPAIGRIVEFSLVEGAPPHGAMEAVGETGEQACPVKICLCLFRAISVADGTEFLHKGGNAGNILADTTAVWQIKDGFHATQRLGVCIKNMVGMCGVDIVYFTGGFEIGRAGCDSGIGDTGQDRMKGVHAADGICHGCAPNIKSIRVLTVQAGQAVYLIAQIPPYDGRHEMKTLYKIFYKPPLPFHYRGIGQNGSALKSRRCVQTERHMARNESNDQLQVILLGQIAENFKFFAGLFADACPSGRRIGKAVLTHAKFVNLLGAVERLQGLKDRPKRKYTQMGDSIVGQNPEVFFYSFCVKVFPHIDGIFTSPIIDTCKKVVRYSFHNATSQLTFFRLIDIILTEKFKKFLWLFIF